MIAEMLHLCHEYIDYGILDFGLSVIEVSKDPNGCSGSYKAFYPVGNKEDTDIRRSRKYNEKIDQRYQKSMRPRAKRDFKRRTR